MIIEKYMWILPIHISIKGSLIKFQPICSMRMVAIAMIRSDTLLMPRFKLRSSTLLCGFFTGRLRWSRGSPIPGSIPV